MLKYQSLRCASSALIQTTDLHTYWSIFCLCIQLLPEVTWLYALSFMDHYRPPPRCRHWGCIHHRVPLTDTCEHSFFSH